MRFISALLFSCLLLCGQEKCRVAGQVINSVTNEPVRKAMVKLTSTGGAARSAVTDATGRFAFADLDAGDYALQIGHADFERQDYPRSHQNGPTGSIVLAPGDDKNDVMIRLVPFGSISGRIVDDDGDPIRRVQINLMAYNYFNGHRQLISRSQTSTDDLGDYRIFEVRRGRYYLKAEVQVPLQFAAGPEADESFAARYYPGSADTADAAILDLHAGQQMRGLDFSLHRTRLATLRGRVIRPTGGSLSLHITKLTDGGGSHSWGSEASVHSDGKFEMHGIFPGTYVVSAQSFAEEKRFGVRVRIEVGTTDVDGIELHLLRAMELDGHLEIEGKSDVKPPQVSFTLASQSTGQPSFPPANVGQDGSLVIRDLEPDIYYISSLSAPRLYLKTIRMGNTDVTDSGIDLTNGAPDSGVTIVLSSNTARIEGVVENDKGEPAADAMVTLLALHPKQNETGRGHNPTDPQGHFSLGELSPGRYRVFAWDQVDYEGSVYDPDFVKPFVSMSETVGLSEGDTKEVHLKLIHNPAAE